MPAKKKRITLELADPVVVEIDRIRSMMELTEPIEVIRRALAVYSLLARHATDGGKVILQEKTGYQKELVVR